jgi:hypothetical protein
LAGGTRGPFRQDPPRTCGHAVRSSCRRRHQGRT